MFWLDHIRKRGFLLSMARLPMLLMLCVGAVSVFAYGDQNTADRATADRATHCGAVIPGAASLLKQSRVLILGEMHGSDEAPAFTAALACHAFASGRAVQVGIELPQTEAKALATYLDGPGGRADRAALLASAFWQRADQDGRSSAAMLGLIERVRQLRQLDARIELFAFDAAPDADWNARDAAMADAILARAEQHVQALIITLSGNLHARASKGLPWDPDAVPMAMHVRARLPEAKALEMRHQGGAVWVCQPNLPCGPMSVRSAAAQTPIDTPAIELWSARNEHGLDGVFMLGVLSASRPAKEMGTERRSGD